MKSKINSFNVIITVVLLTLFLAAGLKVGLVPVHIVYSTGERTGVATKISYKGLICKTYEGELNLGGMASDGAGIAVVNQWKYSVTDKDVVAQIEEASRLGRRITLEYEQYWSNGLCYGKTPYNVVRVK